MNAAFHAGNRQRFYEKMVPDSALVLFSGEEIVRTNDEDYPFFADRSFLYMTGIAQKQSVLLAIKSGSRVQERLYLLPPDPMAERWTGTRLKPSEAEAISGISDIRPLSRFDQEFHLLAAGGHYSAPSGIIHSLYLDLHRFDPATRELPSHKLLGQVQKNYPYLHLENANAILRQLRLIKQQCEIDALRHAEEITGAGILAMMRASRPGMYEYQYKAEYDRALGQYGPAMQGFPPIISAGNNNFCIHYYGYTGQAKDGDMILNDVGAHWDNLITDVSRGWPCNGRFTDKQKLLYRCALETSNHMFATLKPGMEMDFVDREIRRYNGELLREAGVLQPEQDIGLYMWHGGAHHIGYDVHDVVARPEFIAPGMTFCIDVGIYHEEWGIGFRLEDNILITPDGCENLSRHIPRTIEDIAEEMRH